MMKLILQAGNTFSITICLSIICIYITPVGAHANTPCVELRFSNETAHTGDTVTIKLTTRGFSGITGYQFAVRWNPGDLQYLKHTAAGSALDFQLFNAAQNAQGKLLSVWSDVNATGVTLPDDAFLFEIKFKVLAAGPSYFPVFIDPDATPVYELIQYSTTLPLSHVAGGVRIGVSGDLQIASCCVSPPPCNAPLGSAALEVTGGTQPYQYLWEGTGGFTSVSAQPANFSPGSYKVTVTDAAGVQALAVITIPYVYSSVTVSAVDIKNAQCGQANGCISLLANGGVAPYVYQWSTPGSTENNRCDLLPGDHSVTVTDALGCIQSGTFPVGNDEHLSVKLDSINADCRFDQPGGVHSIVTGTAPYTYQWSNGATTADLDGLTPGLYSVTVLDAAGCKTSKAVTVKDYGTFDWFFGLAEKCPTATESGALKLSGYDFAYRAAFPITLIWSTGTVQEVNAVDDNVVWPVLSQLSDLPGNGRYSVTVVDAQGCSASNEAVMNCASYGSIEKFNTRFYIKGTSSGALDSCAVVVAQDFKNISELRFSLRWHPSWMELKDIKNLYPPMGINMSNFTVPSPGWIDFQWNSALPQGYSYPYDFPLFKVCFKNHTWDAPLLDFAYEDEPPAVVHATEGEKGFIGKNGRVFFYYDADSEPVDKFNLAPPDCAYDGFARVQLESYNPAVNPYRSLNFEQGYSNYPKMDADTLLFASPGTFHFRTALNNTMSRFLVHIPPYDLPSSECVWPGDADNNGVVNHFDLLYLGLAMGKQGGGRAELASAWKGSDAADWPEQSPLYHINFKNMDADGNGFVEPADTSIVVMQWGRMIHPYKSDPYAMPGPPDKYNQELSVRILPDTFSSGQAVEIPVILGSTDAQAADFLGLAFSVSCDPDRIVSEMRFEPTGSWMGDPGQDLICIQRSFPGQRRLDVALSRIDGAGVSGAGQIGKLLLTFKPVFSDSITNTPVFISHAMALTAGEDRIGLGSSRTNIFIEKNQSVSATAPSWYGQDIRLSPNPATSVLRIFSLQAAIRRVEISTATGIPQIVFEPEYPVNVAEIRLENVPAGTCIARIFTENGVVSKKFVIAR